MTRRLLLALAALLCAFAVLAPPALARSPQADPDGGSGGGAVGALPPPRGLILVDVDTGAVLVAHNAHEAIGAASTIKIMSSLVISDHVDDATPVPISPVAEGMPARKINVKAGQTWMAGGLLRAMLLCSCNDAAVALAETASGSLEKFSLAMTEEAERIGMVDAPVLNDPSGLDDEFSFRGGNRISAYDLALATRAFLAREDLAAIVALPEASFPGGDGVDHRVVNHNRLLKQYPGAIGLKTGYTERSGYSLVGAARRDGRTLVAIVLDSPNTYQQVTELLDFGFSIPVKDQPVVERLPRADGDGRLIPDPPPTTAAEPGPADGPEARACGVAGTSGRDTPTWVARLPYLLVAVAVAILLRRRQVVLRRRRRAAERRRVMRLAEQRERTTVRSGRPSG